ncbi:uncharacterized protein LOC143341380 [Colletes latitarsis]|uniref:uncharacterized protein LOC143341380 n=1 Tax=Colletes latitarsis TaxID=2605962 RepID=UPI0040352A0F
MTENECKQNYRNVNYKSDSKYTILIARTLLKPTGIWPLDKDDSLLRTVKTFVHIGIIFSLMCFLLVPHVIYTFHDCENLTRYMKVIAAQVFSLLGIIKFWTMIINKKNMRYCLTKIEEQYKNIECEEDRLIMTRSAKIGRFFQTVYLGFTYGGALPYHIILPFMSDRVVKRDNTTQIPLPYLSNYVFFVIEESPIYEIMFVLQMVISTIILSTNTGISSLIATTVMHCYGLFKVVNRKIETIFNGNKKEIQERLKTIVEHHLQAIEFAEMIEKALSIVFFSEIIGNTIIICFLEYGVLVEWEDHKTFSMITYFVLMTSIFVNVFIMSFIGDRLKQESERVGETMYFIRWYDLPTDTVMNIRMIILRTKRPTNLTAANIFDISLQAFCDVCKSSAAYLNFVRTITLVSFYTFVQVRVPFPEGSGKLRKRSLVFLRTVRRLRAFSTYQASVGAFTMQKTETSKLESPTAEQEHRKYMNLSIQWNQWLLKPMGVWPDLHNTSGIEKCSKRPINVVCYGLISFLFIPCVFYVVLDVNDVYNKIKLFGPLSFYVMAYLKYYSLIVHQNDIRECVQRIEWDWRNIKHTEDKNIMIANANFGRQVAKISTFFMYSGFVFYYIAMPTSTGKITAENETLTFVPMVFPFSRCIVDTRYSPVNEIFFSIQFLGGAVIHGIAAAGCSLAAVFAVHACGQMKVLMCWLGHLIDGRADMCKTMDGRIANIINQHVRILKFLALTEKALQQISLVEFAGCTLNLCLLGYYIIMEWDWDELTSAATYFIILMSFLFNIFIFCYIGELVAELCKQVGEMSYMVEWYRLKGNRKLSVVLIIAMSNLSTKLTAGNMVSLSLSTFSDVVKTSVTFLNMLRALT